ncbi:hypothetical protein [Aquimarina algiphila]|uniref:hypothetical protein n=1 Tax=Aquimarina algiphila TaxID=2047982 RepID=UPI00232FD49C|nr:hypothetical protein [Aquimarina algiphila]
MKKQFLNSTTLLIVFSLLFYSCSSSDDSSPEDQGGVTIDGKLIVKRVDANTIVLEYDGTSANKLSYGIRKAGEQTFEKKIVNSVETHITELTPAQQYEVTLLATGDTDFKSEIKTVITQPFNTFEDQSTKVRRYGELFYSEIGFKHQLKTDVFNENANLKFFFVHKDNENEKVESVHTYTNGILSFEAPKDWGSEPYEELRYYYLSYQVDGGDIIKISEPETPENYITFVMYNPTPHITEVESIEKIDNCGGNTYYNLKFNGFFHSTIFAEFYIHREFKKSTAFITRDDDNTEFIIDEGRISGCQYYNRNFVKEEIYLDPKQPIGMNRLHTNKHISIQQLESTTTDAKFTSGSYKIRIVFSNDAGDFYDTNTFSFTLP